MPVQTYASVADVQTSLSAHGYAAALDDDEDGVVEAGEAAYATSLLEATATRMNAYLATRYALADLAGSAWCRWCHADLAACAIYARRAGAPTPGLKAVCDERWKELAAIAAGELRIPDVADSFQQRPTVTNFTIRRGRFDGPILVDRDKSTGENPPDGIKRRVL